MNGQEIRQLKAKAQRLETLLSDFQKDVELLNESGVDVSTESNIANRQEEIQDELEQVTSDILLLLDTSGTIILDGNEINLPNPQRNPVSEGDLPEPSGKRPEGRGAPQWAKGSKETNDKTNNGNGNGNNR